MNITEKDREKIAPEWSICKYCKNNETHECISCTMMLGPSYTLLCGIPIGTHMMYYHKNFERKE